MSDLLLMASLGLPRNGLVAQWDPYRDAYGLDATARAALQTGTDYSGHGNTLTYGATTGASTDDPTNTGTAWSFDGGDYLLGPTLTSRIYSANFVFYTANPITKDTANMQLMGNNTWSGVSLGASTSAVADEIITITGVAGEDSLAWELRAVYSSATGSIAAGWHHLGLSLSGTTTKNYWRIYLDGVDVTTNNNYNINQPLPAGLLTFGAGAYSTRPNKFTGSIALATIYSRPRSPSEMLRAYAYCKSLMAPRGIAL